MRLTDEQEIPASRERVWAGLNNTDILKRCIPGCESIRKIDDTSFEARIIAKVGPVKASFRGRVSLTDLKPPESYVITGQGEGGIAGFAKGRADINLDEIGKHVTKMHYDVDAQIGGKLAMLGSRLIDTTARSMAQQFFKKFVELMSEKVPARARSDKKTAGKPVKRARKPARRR